MNSTEEDLGYAYRSMLEKMEKETERMMKIIDFGYGKNDDWKTSWKNYFERIKEQIVKLDERQDNLNLSLGILEIVLRFKIFESCINETEVESRLDMLILKNVELALC